MVQNTPGYSLSPNKKNHPEGLFRRIIFLIVICAFSIQLKSQVLRDISAMTKIQEGISSVYRLEFDKAHSILNSVSKDYPGHPVLNLFRGMILYWENFPITPGSPSRNLFETEMKRCMDLSDRKQQIQPGYEMEYLLANLCARGFLLLFYTDNDLTDEVFPIATSSYRPLMKSFDYIDLCSDFFYFTGIYNYYREAYPKVYPLYKSIAFLFPQGNMETGIVQLERCSENSMALRAEAAFILLWIKMNFESDPLQALKYSEKITKEYPSNPLYRLSYVKNLLLLKQYDKAEEFMNESTPANENDFYIAVKPIFKAIIEEKKSRNYSAAKSLYESGIKNIARFRPYGNEYEAYAYFGLSRISEASADNQNRRIYRRKAMDMADFKKITFDD